MESALIAFGVLALVFFGMLVAAALLIARVARRGGRHGTDTSTAGLSGDAGTAGFVAADGSHGHRHHGHDQHSQDGGSGGGDPGGGDSGGGDSGGGGED